MIKWHAILPYDFNTVYEVNMNRNIIRQWNKDLSDKNKLISSKDEEGYTLEEWYFYLKMPFIMGDRDLVMKRYVMPNYGGKPKCALIAGYSVDNPDYPDKGKPIRGEMLISGNYFEEIAPQKTLMVVISHADMKFSKTLSKMAKGKGWEKSKENLTKILKGCENYSKGKYTN